MMKVVVDYDELEGEVIAFTQFAQFAERFTIATEEGSILMGTMEVDFDSGEKEIKIYREIEVIMELDNDEWLRGQLLERGLFDVEAYKERRRKEEEEREKERKKRIEKRELDELVRLQEKYKNRGSK